MKKKVLRLRFAPFARLIRRTLVRITSFFLLMLLSATTLYITGNFQRFTDASQAVILKWMIFIAMTLIFFAGATILATTLDCVFSKTFSWKKMAIFVFCLLCGALSIAIAVTASAILEASAAFS